MPSLDLLVMCPVSTLGGAERVSFQIARGARRAGRTCHALFKEPIEQPEMLSWYSPLGIATSTTPNFKPLKPKLLLRSMLGLRHDLRALAPKVVNLHNPGNTILASDVLAVRLAGVKRIICSLHHPLPPETLPRSWKASTRIASTLATTITVTTPVLQQTVMTMGVPASQITVVPLGVEPLPRTLTQTEARRELGVSNDLFVVGTLGRMVPYKRMDAVIRACAAAPGFKDKGYLLLAGGGEEEKGWKDLANELLPNSHRFLGHLTDPSAFYAALDLFALPSELEGFGLVYPEAGLAGVPSVGSNAGGAPFAIKDGETGVLLPVDHPERLEDIVSAGLHDRQELRGMGRAAKDFAENELGISTFERRMMELFFPAQDAT